MHDLCCRLFRDTLSRQASPLPTNFLFTKHTICPTRVRILARKHSPALPRIQLPDPWFWIRLQPKEGRSALKNQRHNIRPLKPVLDRTQLPHLDVWRVCWNAFCKHLFHVRTLFVYQNGISMTVTDEGLGCCTHNSPSPTSFMHIGKYSS